MHKRLIVMIPRPGFTIVELLIVIVIIGILAAITIVAFSSVQARANNAKDVSAATAYSKAFKMLVEEKGESVLPTTDSCLGTSAMYPAATPKFQQDQCSTYSYDNGVTYGGSPAAIFPMSLLSPYMTTIPEASNLLGHDNGASSGALQESRGLLYQKLNYSSWKFVGRISWMRNGRNDCPKAYYDSAADVTWCYIYF